MPQARYAGAQDPSEEIARWPIKAPLFGQLPFTDNPQGDLVLLSTLSVGYIYVLRGTSSCRKKALSAIHNITMLGNPSERADAYLLVRSIIMLKLTRRRLIKQASIGAGAVGMLATANTPMGA